jgi:hypothetical protein
MPSATYTPPSSFHLSATYASIGIVCTLLFYW